MIIGHLGPQSKPNFGGYAMNKRILICLVDELIFKLNNLELLHNPFLLNNILRFKINEILYYKNYHLMMLQSISII